MHREKEVRYDPQTGEKIVTEDVVADRPVERIVERPTIIKRRAGVGTWLGGALFGVIVAAGAYAYFAQEQGSYRAAGAVVDQKVAVAEQKSGEAAQQAGDAAKQAGDKIENSTDKN